MKLTSLYSFILLIFSTSATAMFCPSNLNQISIGDTLDIVLAQCGKPESKKSYKKTSATPQEWSYFIKVVPQMSTQDQGTMKVSFAFVNNQLINMSVNGIGVGASEICGPNIELGANMETVEAACGKPVNITGLNNIPGEKDQPAPDITELKYGVPAPNTLVFENGVLKERK